MARARIGNPWQVTIPIEVRKRYGLNAGDEVDLIPAEKGVQLIPLKRKNVKDPSGERYVGKNR